MVVKRSRARHMREYSYLKRALLRELSEDARASVTELAKKLKCSRNTVVSNMRFLEKEFGLRYTVQFRREALRIPISQVWHVRLDTVPKSSELKKIFQDDTYVQFVARTEGDFNLLLLTAADSGEKYMTWSMETLLKLLPYGPQIRPSMIALRHTGFVPMQTMAVKRLAEMNPKMDELDVKILVLLDNNARITYEQMAKKLKMDVEKVRYRFRRILKMGAIRRFTVVMDRPPETYKIAFFINCKFAPGVIERYRKMYQYYVDADKGLPLINKFQYLTLVTGSYVFFGMGCFENEETAIREAILSHQEIYKEDNPRISFAKISEILKGTMPSRNIDIAKEFRHIQWGDVTL